MQKRAGNLFATAYLLLIFGIYPLYMKQGYVDIGEAKFWFFMYCSLAGLGILLLIGAFCACQTLYRRYKQREPYLIDWDKLSVTDLFVMLYAVEVFISYVMSDYRQEALWGTEGWKVGLALWLVLCGLYFLISRFWDERALVWYVGAAVSGAVFLLCILDRFSFYLIPLEIRDPAFVSTMGNINWFCGYASVLAPVGICGFLFSGEGKEKKNFSSGKKREEKGKRALFFRCRRAAGLIYAVIAFMAGFCQGADSIFLFFGALFYILLWIVVEKRSRLRDWFLLVSLWGFSAQGVRLLRWLLPLRYNYDTDNLCAYMTDSGVTLVVGALFFLGFLFLCWKGEKGDDEGGLAVSAAGVLRARWGMAIALAGAVALWLLLAFFNTREGISFLEENSLFLLDGSWGNGRGAALRAGVDAFRGMPLSKKLFGVGPDCFSVYVYSLPEVAEDIRNSFGGSRLTNAHNELLTSLVNTGIIGTFLYLGIFLSFVVRAFKKGLDRTAACTAAVCVLCYLAHNMISFAQVLNLPFVFLIMALGEKSVPG